MQDEISIRHMAITDYDNVFRVWKSVPGMGISVLDDSRERIAKFLKRNPCSCFIAAPVKTMDEVCGAILSGHDGRRAYIYHIAVKEECRGKGIGTALVQAVEKALTEEGIYKIALLVFKSNKAGNRFWEKRGYVERRNISYRGLDLNPGDTEPISKLG